MKESMTTRQLSLLVGIMAGMAVIHGWLVTPMVKDAMRPTIREMIELHRQEDIHHGAMRRSELLMQFGHLERELKEIKEKMEAK